MKICIESKCIHGPELPNHLISEYTQEIVFLHNDPNFLESVIDPSKRVF